jgi:glutathionylspermidine synthase
MTPLSCGSLIPRSTFATIRRRMVLEFCKWDPQVEDVSTLCPYPLLLQQDEWNQLIQWSEQLADETLNVEAELLQRPDLLCQLGLPRPVRKLLTRATSPAAASLARIMRFDFHWTTDGWRISEVNSDVPGGFIESSAFTHLVEQATPATMSPGDPAGLYAEAIAQSGMQRVGLVHATAYSDDRQVMTYLAQRLRQQNVEAVLGSPADVTWSEGRALLRSGSQLQDVDGLVRFFPGEWLPNLKRRPVWEPFFVGSRTPISNPATALVSQSKRLPLVWDRLKTSVQTWKELLPETADPRRVPWKRDDQWVLKPALGRVGEMIGLHGVTSGKDWRAIRRSATWWPGHWVAQKRFQMQPIAGPQGVVYPVIGVYTVDRRVAGIYARLAQQPLINHLAQDVAVLIPQPSFVDEASEVVGSSMSSQEAGVLK